MINLDYIFEDISNSEYTTSDYNRSSKIFAWKTAIGLQYVDNMETSDYLKDVAIKNINNEISIDTSIELIENYYSEKSYNLDDTEEADKVSVRIAKILSENSFRFSVSEYISIHNRLFSDIYTHAGRIRDYNISKKEWVLNGKSVTYGSYYNLKTIIEYDFNEEREFSYKSLTVDEVIKHISLFTSRIWQAHIFGEGNTRTTAIFLIKYLRTLGFYVSNDVFLNNSWYFRNALVRANYNDIKNGIYENREYLELFLRNLLLDETNILSNIELHVFHTNTLIK